MDLSPLPKAPEVVATMNNDENNARVKVYSGRSRCTRSNSTSTVKVEYTMSHPDNEGTIHAVAQELHEYLCNEKKVKYPPMDPREALMLSEAKRLRVFNEESPFDENFPDDGYYDSSDDDDDSVIYDDIEEKYSPIKVERGMETRTILGEKPVISKNQTTRQSKKRMVLKESLRIPSVFELANYLHNMFTTAQCSEECNIICLIYVERLLECSRDPAGLNGRNWKSIVMMAMLLASKVWDDLSMVNEDFSIFMPYTLDQINTWEIEFLGCIKFNVRVSASQYARYYFDLRKKIHHNGAHLPKKELTMERARKLEALTSCMEQRAKEMHNNFETTPSTLSQSTTCSNPSPSITKKKIACVVQIPHLKQNHFLKLLNGSSLINSKINSIQFLCFSQS